MFQEYVLGFAFDTYGEKLALIRKNRPAWQKGKLNGIGGKVAEGEAPLEAMVREFNEEAGALTKPGNWNLIGALHGEQFRVWVYGARLPCVHENKLTSPSDEKVEVVWYSEQSWKADCLDTVPFLAEYARSPIPNLFLMWGYDKQAGPAAFSKLVPGKR